MGRYRFLTFFLSPFLIGSGHAAAAADITIERSYDSREFNLHIIGKIERGDDEKFREKMLLGIGLGLLPGGVTIYSQGGAVAPAMSIGRQRRTAEMWTSGPQRQPMYGKKSSMCVGRVRDERGADVAGGFSEFMWTRNSPRGLRGGPRKVSEIYDDARCICASACFLIWAGGTSRVASVIGVHRPYFDPQEFAQLGLDDAVSRYDAMADTVKAYLGEMDVPDRIAKKMMKASSEDIAELDERDLEDLDNSGGGEGYHELQIAKCGTVQQDLKQMQYKPGQACNAQCQARILAFHKKMADLEKCYETIKQQEGPRKSVEAYVARYRNGIP